MKIRNGFVSNSSSSSFIINYPKKELRLSDVESYFGGYNSDIPTHLQDTMSYVLWKNQFDSNYEISKSNRHECILKNEDDTPLAQKCPKRYTYVHGYDYDDDEDNSCYRCRYWQSISEETYIDNLIKNCYYSKDIIEQLKNFKENCGRIKSFEIDDNCYDNDSYLSYSDAYDIRKYAGNIFKSHDKVIEEKE